MSPFTKYIQTTICFTALSLSSSLYSVTVNTEAELNSALLTGATTIDFGSDIALTNFLFPVNSDLKFAPTAGPITINGNNFSVSGGNNIFKRGLFVHGGTATINNLFFGSIKARGGTGVSGGGGGAGFGGGLFIEKDSTVTLVNPIFSNCIAQGGEGFTASNSPSTNGGGGGLGGDSGTTRYFGGLGGGSLFQNGGNTSGLSFGGTGGGGVGTPGGNTSSSAGAAGGGGL